MIDSKKTDIKSFIFLDIDGVLSLDFDEYEYSNKSKWFEKMPERCPLNKKAVKKFNEILALVINPVIVLSSDWKDHYNIDLMNEFFEWQGIICPITDYTKTLWGIDFFRVQQLEDCRAAEILDFVGRYDIQRWVAIDDLDLSPWIPNNFVHTPRGNEGIKQSGVKDKILNILNSNK